MITTRPLVSTPATTTAASPLRRRNTRRVAVLAAAALGAVCMNTAVAAADTIPTANRVFELENAYSKQSIDISGGSTAAGAPAIQWPSNGQANQRFYLIPQQGWEGWYRIKAQHSGLCLQAQANQLVEQQPCRAGSDQLWYLARNDYGYYRFKNLWTSHHLHAPNQTSGSQLSADSTFGVTDRMWNLKETKVPYSDTTPGVDVPWGAIGTSETGYCSDGWRIELDSGSWNPRYNNIGDSAVQITGNIFFTGSLGRFANVLAVNTSENDARKIKVTYYQNSGRDYSRNYALTGRVRFYCVPGTSF